MDELTKRLAQSLEAMLPYAKSYADDWLMAEDNGYPEDIQQAEQILAEAKQHLKQ